MEVNELIKLYDQADIADWFTNEPLYKSEPNNNNNNYRVSGKNRVIFTTLVTGVLVACTIGLITFFVNRKGK